MNGNIYKIIFDFFRSVWTVVPRIYFTVNVLCLQFVYVISENILLGLRPNCENKLYL